jgi:hypothetical protein
MSGSNHWQQLIKNYHREGARMSLDDWLIQREMESIAREKAKVNGNGSQPIPEVYCQCDELVINGERLPCPPWHDCSHIKTRSELVPKAVALADAVIANNTANGSKWTRRFVQEMERLSAPLLRQSNNGAHEQKAV